MDCFALIALLVIVALIAGIAAGLMYAEIKSQEKRITALEAAQAKHLPYQTADELEHGLAALNNLQFDLNYKQDMIDNALAHFLKARNGNAK